MAVASRHDLLLPNAERSLQWGEFGIELEVEIVC